MAKEDTELMSAVSMGQTGREGAGARVGPEAQVSGAIWSLSQDTRDPWGVTSRLCKEEWSCAWESGGGPGRPQGIPLRGPGQGA